MYNAMEAVDELIDDINNDYYGSCYDAIYEELCDRVECGELTIEEAEMINDVAYDKYVTEFESDVKRAYAIKRGEEKLSHNHDASSRKLVPNLSRKEFNKRMKEYRASDRYVKGKPIDDYPIDRYDHASRHSKAYEPRMRTSMIDKRGADWSNGEMVRAQIPSYLRADKSNSERKKNEYLQSKK